MNSIPESHKDLLERPIIVSLATLMPDGQPQVTPIWADLDNGHIRVNTVAGRQKYNNLKARQQATVLVFDPENPMRYIEVRGEVVSESESDGIAVIDKARQGLSESGAVPLAQSRGHACDLPDQTDASHRQRIIPSRSHVIANRPCR